MTRETEIDDEAPASEGAAVADAPGEPRGAKEEPTHAPSPMQAPSPTQEPPAAHEDDPEEGATLRQLVIVAILVGALLLLHKFGSTETAGHFDPTAMLALGFVILASFTIGHLVDVIKLPHITGYLLAGMLFGPSIAGFVPVVLWAPFDRGVLNDAVIRQLRPIETLAVALIAITAGGELKLESLRKGLRAISSILLVQLLAVLGTSVGFFYLVGGTFEALTLPGLGELAPEAIVPLGLALGAIAFATSPAATIAVINETGARGPMTRTVLSTVVLKDVVVVVLFGVFSALAIQAMGGASEGDLAATLASEIGLSVVAGALLGVVMGLYMRFVGQELMLFIAGVVYLGSFLAQHAHLDTVLVFLVAGFVVSNYSKKGDTLIHAVERLSLPVYVVFFTLAGAKLHLHEVIHLFVFALALVLARVAGMYLGVRLGSVLGRADEGTRRFGWMGFVSQAGVAITLAGFVKERFGEPGVALSNLLIAGVAINEILGPVLLKVGLGLARETRAAATEPAEGAQDATPSAPAEVEPWPEPVLEVDWGQLPPSAGDELRAHLRELEHDLKELVRQFADGPIKDFETDAEEYFRDLRREFLRQHRRLLVTARATRSEDPERRRRAREELQRHLRVDQADFADRWRSIVLARSVQLSDRSPWTPEPIVTALDDYVDALPELVCVPWDERLFEPHDDDGPLKGARRRWLRLRRGLRRLLGRDLPPRPVALRDLARYHLGFQTPPRLEGVAALFVQAEQHIAGRTRQIFDATVRAYDALSDEALREDVDLEEALHRLRAETEEDLRLALDEVGRIAREGSVRTARILAQGLRAIKDEAPLYGTLDLPERKRRSSRAFRARVNALGALTETLTRLRKSSGGELALLAMELELVGLEAQVKNLLAEHASRFEGEIERRVVQQIERVRGALDQAAQQVALVLAEGDSPEVVGAALREATSKAAKIAGNAARVVRELHDEFLDEDKIRPLLDSLSAAALSLTSHYEVSAWRMQRGEYKLPPVVERVEVPFREVVLAHVETRVAPELFRVARDAASRLQPLASAMKEIERLLAFNAELASSELELVLEDTIPTETRQLLDELLEGQLKRSEDLAENYLEQARQWGPELAETVRRAVIGGVEALRGQLVDGEITRAKVDELRRDASRRRLAQRASQLPKLLREATGELTRALATMIGEERLQRWRRALGLPPPRVSRTLDPRAFRPPQPTVELPPVYRRLFAAETMEAADVLTGREEAIARARAVLEGWPGSMRSVAIVGLDGVGKASVTAAVARAGRWRRVARINLQGPVDERGVDALLAQHKDAQLVVVENVHWMLSTCPGGFAPLRRFVDAVLEDHGRRGWILSCEQLFHSYASSVAPLTSAFPETIVLEPLSPDELRAAVMERHRLSGYDHVFGRFENGSRVEGLVARGASRIRRPYEQYFQDLHAATGGILRDALRLWLASIQGIEDDRVVRVGAVPPTGLAAMSQLPDETLLQLFLVARQGWIDCKALAWLLRVSPQDARAHLVRLAHLGLLEEHAEGTYRIAIHLRGITARVLRQRGWMT